MAVLNWPSRVNWSQFKKLRKPPPGESLDAHIEGEWANPPGKKFMPRQDAKGSWLPRPRQHRCETEAAPHLGRHGEGDPLPARARAGHWDLLGLCVRELHQDLAALRTTSSAQLGPEADKLTRWITDKAFALDEKYDDETKHSLDKANQTKWKNVFQVCMMTRRHLPDA